MKRKDGKQVFWTDDPNLEMPIEVPKPEDIPSILLAQIFK